MVNQNPVAFATDQYLPDYPVVVIDARILITLWSKERAYLTDIVSDGRYTREKIEGDYARLIERHEPIIVPFINVSQTDKDPHISFNDGRHRVRYLLDTCAATQIPVMLDEAGAKFLVSRNYARHLTGEEEQIMRQHNRNSDALRLLHRAYEIVTEAGLSPTQENINAALDEYYKDHSYYEYLVPLETAKDYFRPFTSLREVPNWQSATANIQPGQRIP